MSDYPLTPVPDPQVPVVPDEQSRALQEQVTLELVSLVTDGVRTGLQIWKGREFVQAKWEDVKQQIALIEANSRPVLEKLEHELQMAGTRTHRLQILLDSFAQLPMEKSMIIGPSIGKAIEQLTRE
jgi:hypothetical protein